MQDVDFKQSPVRIDLSGSCLDAELCCPICVCSNVKLDEVDVEQAHLQTRFDHETITTQSFSDDSRPSALTVRIACLCENGHAFIYSFSALNGYAQVTLHTGQLDCQPSP